MMSNLCSVECNIIDTSCIKMVIASQCSTAPLKAVDRTRAAKEAFPKRSSKMRRRSSCCTSTVRASFVPGLQVNWI